MLWTSRARDVFHLSTTALCLVKENSRRVITCCQSSGHAHFSFYMSKEILVPVKVPLHSSALLPLLLISTTFFMAAALVNVRTTYPFCDPAVHEVAYSSHHLRFFQGQKFTNTFAFSFPLLVNFGSLSTFVFLLSCESVLLRAEHRVILEI